MKMWLRYRSWKIREILKISHFDLWPALQLHIWTTNTSVLDAPSADGWRRHDCSSFNCMRAAQHDS